MTNEELLPSLLSTQAEAMVERAKHLGLTWTLRPATVTDLGANPSVICDGDTAVLGAISLIGQVFDGKRVTMLQIPPGGNFIIGTYGEGQFYQARTTLTTAANVIFSGIPTNLRSLKLSWTARGTAAVATQAISMQFNADASAAYYHEFLQGLNVTASAGNGTATTSAHIGLVVGASASATVYGSGTVDIVGWDAPHSTSLGWTYSSQALGSSAAAFTHQTGGGVWLGGTGSNSSLVIGPSSGTFDVESDFQLFGEYS